MAVLTHIIAELGHAVGRLVGNAVPVEDPGVHPDAVAFAFQDQKLGIRADGVEVFLDEDFTLQVFPLQHEPVALQAGIALDFLCHEVQCFLLAGAHHVLAWIHIAETDARGHVDVAVDDARHDELPAEVGYLALIVREARLVAYIDKLAVLHHQGCRLRISRVCCEDFGILDNLVCFHIVLL